MSNSDVQIEINNQLDAAVNEIELAKKNGKCNHSTVHFVGGVAVLLGRGDLAARAENLLADLTLEDFYRGSIRNFEPNEADARRLRRLTPLPQYERWLPLLTHESLLAKINRYGQTQPHLKLFLLGNVKDAVAAAKSEMAVVEIGCTLAIMGRFQEAIAFMEAQRASEIRQTYVRDIILMEKCRRRDQSFQAAIRETTLYTYDRTHVALALAGRLPWQGYPYPDW